MSSTTPTKTPPRASSIKVGLGQLVVSKSPSDVLSALGLGSCIGLTVFDPVTKIGGMVHVMLPSSEISTHSGPDGKYADTAIPALVDQVSRLGGDPSRLVCKMAGGAQMFSGGSGGGSLNIGSRNAIAVRAALQVAGLRLKSAQTGGTFGRTVDIHIGTGLVTVRTVGGAIEEL